PSKDNYLTHTRGLLSWALTLDHKRIGVMYMVAVLISFFVGAIAALLGGTKLMWPGEVKWMTPDHYNVLFTIHGAVMVFLVIIPSIPAAMGNFVLPIMLGAKDVAFPRLNLMSWWLWVTGAFFFIMAVVGWPHPELGPDGAWHW